MQCKLNSEVERHGVTCCMLWTDICVCTSTQCENVCVGCISPSTHAGRARVVPAICPLRQAQRAVCLAIVRLGWLLSLFNITISHVPTANWPVEDTHGYIHFRKCDIKNTDISNKILLYILQHEGLISLKISLSLHALLCSSLRVIAKAIMEGNKRMAFGEIEHLKERFPPKWTLPLFTQSHVVSNLCNFLFLCETQR